MAALPPVAFDVLDVNSSGEFSVTASPAALVPPTSPDEFASAFAEVREVGRGRFGAAILVRHVASGGEYILKRTQFGSKGQLTAAAVGTEADALARMHHENIVRYYQAWIEDRAPRAQRGRRRSGMAKAGGRSPPHGAQCRRGRKSVGWRRWCS